MSIAMCETHSGRFFPLSSCFPGQRILLNVADSCYLYFLCAPTTQCFRCASPLSHAVPDVKMLG